MSRHPQGLEEVKVERGKNGKVPPRGKSEFVYVNSAFVGSVNNVNSVSNVNSGESRSGRTPGSRTPAATEAPITGVYREQYWACSRWPYTQRVLAIAVGVLLGALIGLAISMIIKDDGDAVLGPIFTARRTVPD